MTETNDHKFTSVNLATDKTVCCDAYSTIFVDTGEEYCKACNATVVDYVLDDDNDKETETMKTEEQVWQEYAHCINTAAILEMQRGNATTLPEEMSDSLILRYLTMAQTYLNVLGYELDVATETVDEAMDIALVSVVEKYGTDEQKQALRGEA